MPLRREELFAVLTALDVAYGDGVVDDGPDAIEAGQVDPRELIERLLSLLDPGVRVGDTVLDEVSGDIGTVVSTSLTHQGWFGYVDWRGSGAGFAGDLSLLRRTAAE